jgi:hypothetical protein
MAMRRRYSTLTSALTGFVEAASSNVTAGALTVA